MTIDIDEARVECDVLNLALAPIVVPILAGATIGFAQWIVLR